MLDEFYDAIFEDARGREVTQIHNDGRQLRVTLRGIDFVGPDFDALSPVEAQLECARSRFTLTQNELCSCRLEWTMPLGLERSGEPYTGSLAVCLVLGDPRSGGGITSEVLTLEVETVAGVVRSSGRSGWFEDELLELEKALQDVARVRSCITCGFSDYSPAGHGLFGGLACFRDAKDEYLETRDKAGVFAIWPRLTEFVQETYVCGEYRTRVPGTGYRG